ncbi:MAG: CapA family protein [bacterium]|nr:CapA family protein [bacterium]
MYRKIVSVGLLAVAAAACSPTRDIADSAEVNQSSVTAAPTVAQTSTTTSSTTTTTTTTTTIPPKGRLVISGVGDTNLDPNYIDAFRREGYAHAFSGLQGVFLEDDLTIVNLECAASELGSRLAKTFAFNCDVDALLAMQAAGVEVANLGNNHSGDWGEEALLDTRINVETAGMAAVGTGEDAVEAHEPALFEINGWTIAVLGFGGVVPWADWIATADDPGMADGDTIETMVAAVEAADAVADLVFVSIHWGVELDTQPRQEDIARAEAMIDAGADGIFGHHPHRLQPLGFYEGKPIAWSLGNFVWPRFSVAGATTAVAQFIVEPDGSIDACLIPTVIETSGHPVIQVQYQGLCNWD